MKKIKFCHNWNNKLNNKVFTTIRKYTDEKCDYYIKAVGEDFEVMLNNKPFSVATLRNVCYISTLVNLKHTELTLDTGIIKPHDFFTLFERFGIKSTDRVIQLMFENKNFHM